MGPVAQAVPVDLLKAAAAPEGENILLVYRGFVKNINKIE